MASANINEMDKAKLDPSEDRAPPIRVQADTSLDPNVDPREDLEGHIDQLQRQNPSPQDNLQPQNPNQVAANIERNKIFLGLSFPIKLWMIVEDNTFTSVHWNENGDTLIIKEDLFQREVLCHRGTEKIFESDSLKSFICLMNLYGFSKIHVIDSSVGSPGNRSMIYHNSSFQRDKPWLIKNIKREGNWMTTAAWPGTSTTPLKRKNQVASTRHSPRINHREGSKAADPETQKKAPSAQGPSGTRSFKFSGLLSTSSAMIVHCPSEPGGPSREGTSRNVMFAPTAPAGTNGTGELPISHPDYPLYDSVMPLYNTCYSILMAALSVMAPPTDPNEGEGGSSDDLCALDEQFRDNTGP